MKVYPPVPIPPQEMDLDIKKAVNLSVKYVQNYVKNLIDDEMQGFLKLEQTIPKVLYFTEKRLPLSIKALSNNFNKKLQFAMVKKDQSELVSHFNVKEFPSLYVL